jgi:hypothetical protein
MNIDSDDDYEEKFEQNATEDHDDRRQFMKPPVQQKKFNLQSSASKPRE